MKKIIIFLALILPLSFALNAQQANKSLKRIKIIDQNENSHRQWQLYVFEMEDQQPVDFSLLKKNLAAIKGIIVEEPKQQNVASRISIDYEFGMSFRKNPELKKAFNDSGFDVINISEFEKK